MIRIFLLSTILFIFQASNAQQRIFSPYSNILLHVYKLNGGKMTGTCFAASHKNQVYFITARHLFHENVNSGDSVKVKLVKDEKLISDKIRVHFHKDTSIDVAIFKLDLALNPNHLLHLGLSSTIAQELLFLGYPLKYQLSTKTEYGEIPLVKKATFAGEIIVEGHEVIALDGISNVGFSGGPVVAMIGNTQYILGVMRSYVKNKVEVPRKDTLKSEYYINENTGIAIAENSKYVIEVIEDIDRK